MARRSGSGPPKRERPDLAGSGALENTTNSNAAANNPHRAGNQAARLVAADNVAPQGWQAGRATLRLIVDNGSAGKTTAAHHPAQLPPPPEPLDEWKRRFLRGLAAWPFTLHPAQRDVLRWIAES